MRSLIEIKLKSKTSNSNEESNIWSKNAESSETVILFYGSKVFKTLGILLQGNVKVKVLDAPGNPAIISPFVKAHVFIKIMYYVNNSVHLK